MLPWRNLVQISMWNILIFKIGNKFEKEKSMYIVEHPWIHSVAHQFTISAIEYSDGTANDSCVHLGAYRDDTCGLDYIPSTWHSVWHIADIQ